MADLESLKKHAETTNDIGEADRKHGLSPERLALYFRENVLSHNVEAFTAKYKLWFATAGPGSSERSSFSATFNSRYTMARTNKAHLL
jgi:hypothetical protein